MAEIVIGDIHGNFNFLIKELKRKCIPGDTVFQVGDFGIGFLQQESDERNLNFLNLDLEELGVTLYVIRGNHDNPIFFNGEYSYSNLKLLPDYSVIKIKNKNILCIGGAVSIDRLWRIAENQNNIKLNLPNRSWWPTEIFNLDEKKIKKMKDINYVITHTAPDFCDPTNDYGNWNNFVGQFFKDDPTLKNMLIEERKEVTSAYKILNKNNNIKKWYYGHFHVSDEFKHNSTKFICLNVGEMKEML